MKKRIVSFVLAAMLGVFCCMPILDVHAKPKTVSKEPLRYEVEVIRNDFAEGGQNCSQSDVTDDLDAIWDCYSIGRPFKEYKA